jgi:flagellar FliJ protein
MKRADRLDVVQRVTKRAERERAEQLALAERLVVESESKLAELTRYRQEYERNFQRGAGSDVTRIRDYQVFLARLGEAIAQQRTLVTQAQARRTAEFARWQEAAQRTRAIGTLSERWQAEERRESDRLEQRDSDERALRSGLHPNPGIQEP